MKRNIWISLQELWTLLYGEKIGCSKELQVSFDCDGVLLESVDVTEYHTKDAHSNVDLIIKKKIKINKQRNVENIKLIL